MQKRNIYLKGDDCKIFDVNQSSNCTIDYKATQYRRLMPKINLFLFSLLCTFGPSAHANIQSLLESDLSGQSLYASGYITMGARTTVGGNVQSATAVTLAADAIVGGNLEAGTAVTLGADAGVVGYIEAATTATIGASAIVDGSILAGTTATIGVSAQIIGGLTAGTTATFDATAEVGGDVLAGTTTTIGAGVQIDGILTANSLKLPADPPLVTNQEVLVTSLQTSLKDLGTGTELVSITFGVNDEILEAGIYSSIDYLTITGGKTLTLDGKGVDGTWVFNIANYLSLAIDAKIILKDVTDNSSIIWNVLGDKTGSAG